MQKNKHNGRIKITYETKGKRNRPKTLNLIKDSNVHSMNTYFPLGQWEGKQWIKIFIETVVYLSKSKVPLFLKYTIIFRYTMKERMPQLKYDVAFLITDYSTYRSLSDSKMAQGEILQMKSNQYVEMAGQHFLNF